MFTGGLIVKPSAPFEEILCESLTDSLPTCSHEEVPYAGVPFVNDAMMESFAAADDSKMKVSQSAVVVGKPVAEKKKLPKENLEVYTHPDPYEAPIMVEAGATEAGYPSASGAADFEFIAADEALELDAAQAADRQAALDANKEAWRKLIAESWAELKEIEKNGQNKDKKKNEDEMEQKLNEASKSRWSLFGGSSKAGKSKSVAKEGEDGSASASSNAKNNGSNEKTFDVPQTFDEMVTLNCNMIGANPSFIKAVKSCFEDMVTAVSNGEDGQLELQANIVCIRIHKEVEGNYKLNDFKMCMLASLRSLLPKSWSISHDQAWNQMWSKTEAFMTANIGLPARYEKAVHKLFNGMDEEQKRNFGLNAFNRLFDVEPRSEDHFNTSNSRLAMLATRSLELAAQMYKEPTRVLQETQSLGLRHIMYNIPTKYFDPFVQGIVDEVACFTDDQEAIKGIEWSLTQIACIMVYAIDRGSSPLLRAVVSNSPKEVRAALSGVARKDRAGACL